MLPSCLKTIFRSGGVWWVVGELRNKSKTELQPSSVKVELEMSLAIFSTICRKIGYD